jgi:hypothetical protein
MRKAINLDSGMSDASTLAGVSIEPPVKCDDDQTAKKSSLQHAKAELRYRFAGANAAAFWSAAAFRRFWILLSVRGKQKRQNTRALRDAAACLAPPAFPRTTDLS